MIRALLAGIAVAVIAPVIGSFLVARGQSLFADTLAHVALMGVAIGVLTNIFPMAAAVICSALAAIGMAFLYVKRKVFPDAILALFLYGSLAMAVLLMSLAKSFNVNLLSVLFGSLLTVQQNELYLIGALSIITVAVVGFLYKGLLFISFDEEVAKVSGLPVARLTFLLMVLAAIVVSLSIRVVGALLIGALVVIPPISSMQFKLSFRATILLSVVFSVLSVFIGLVLSFYLGLASGGTIVIVALGLFLISFFLNRQA
jgi:zinc transport system permease protein